MYIGCFFSIHSKNNLSNFYIIKIEILIIILLLVLKFKKIKYEHRDFL